IDGSQRWKRSTGGVIYSSPAFTALDTAVVVGSDDGMVYAVHANTSAPNYGHTAWTYSVGQPVRSSPAPNSAGDIIVADITGKVWVFGPPVMTSVPGAPPAGSVWRAEPNPTRGEVWIRPGPGAVSEARLEILD